MTPTHLDTDEAIIRLADARAALTGLSDALHPNAASVRTRLADAEADVRAHVPSTATLNAVRVAAAERIEREQAARVAVAATAAKGAVASAQTSVNANLRALEEIPDYRPARRAGETDTAHQVACLRTELQLRDVRADVRDEPTDEVLAVYDTAHTNADWLTAHAAHAELERRLRVPTKAKNFGEAAGLDAERGRIRAGLDAARARRAAAVDAATKATVHAHAEQWTHLDAELQRQAGLVYTIAQLGRYALDVMARA